MDNDTEKQKPETPSKDGWLKRMSHHHYTFSILGLITIIGTVFGIWGYFVSITEPDLTYYVSPTRTPIVQKGHLENFSVNFQGLQITNDLSGAEIQIWNQGKKPIKSEDIRKTVTIRTPHGEPIYQYAVTSSRDVVTFIGATNGNAMSGVLKIDWDNLERDDGFKIQIIYSGKVDLPLFIDGVVVGQKTVDQYDISNGRGVTQIQLFNAIFVTVSLFSISALILMERKLTKKQSALKFSLNIVVLVLLVIQFCGIIYGILRALFHSKPPFGL